MARSNRDEYTGRIATSLCGTSQWNIYQESLKSRTKSNRRGRIQQERRIRNGRRSSAQAHQGIDGRRRTPLLQGKFERQRSTPLASNESRVRSVLGFTPATRRSSRCWQKSKRRKASSSG